jgi:hypothetical protein
LPLARFVAGEGKREGVEKMNTTNWVTVLIGAFITLLPQLVTSIPAPYQQLATGIIAAIVAWWHLYQPSPSQQQTK